MNVKNWHEINKEYLNFSSVLAIMNGALPLRLKLDFSIFTQ